MCVCSERRETLPSTTLGLMWSLLQMLTQRMASNATMKFLLFTQTSIGHSQFHWSLEGQKHNGLLFKNLHYIYRKGTFTEHFIKYMAF